MRLNCSDVAGYMNHELQRRTVFYLFLYNNNIYTKDPFLSCINQTI